MLRFSTTDSAPLEIQITLTEPTVYLDYSVIVRLATDSLDEGRQFREVLNSTDGTLMLSWAHIIELFGLGQGPTLERVASYLKTFGGRFAIIDADSDAVIARENRWVPGRQNPALDEDFMKIIAAKWDGRTELSLGILLDAIANEDGFFQKIKVLHGEQKANWKRIFDQQRERYRSDANARGLLDGAEYLYFPPGFMTDIVRKELMRECVRTNEQFNLSDGLDLYHAVVSVSYCTHVVFDRKWARRCRSINLPAAAAVVFDGTQMNELLGILGSKRVSSKIQIGVGN
jgi:hypothetical protein